MTEETYIAEVLREQDAYRTAAPAPVNRMLRSVSRPISVLTHRLIPPEAIETALRGADWAASASIRKAAITHDRANLRASDEAAEDIRRWALGYAMTSGGAAGAFGAVGLAVDVPTTITLALRTVRLTGLCYGFGAETAIERVFIYDTLQLAGANSAAEKAEALGRLRMDHKEVPRESWGRIVKLTGQTAGAQATARRVAAILGVNLSARKVAQIAPFVGAAIGAGVNAAFQNDVARAARHAYRDRWLQLNAGILDGEALPAREGER